MAYLQITFVLLFLPPSSTSPPLPLCPLTLVAALHFYVTSDTL